MTMDRAAEARGGPASLADLAGYSGLEYGKCDPYEAAAVLITDLRLEPLAEAPSHSETEANLLTGDGSNFDGFSELSLIYIVFPSDFDSAIPRFESWRPSQAPPPSKVTPLPVRTPVLPGTYRMRLSLAD
jgi:hypothetical protein